MAMGDPRPIGIFDSGVGGLTVLSAIRKRLPHEPTIYLADLFHFPYGPRYQDEVRGFAFEIIRYLEARDVKLVVDRKSTRLNSSHVSISYAVFCLKKKNKN